MGLDFSRYRFVGCSFRNAEFNIHCLLGLLSIMFLDSSSFFSCDLSGSDVDFCSFGKCSLWTVALRTPSLSNQASMAL